MGGQEKRRQRKKRQTEKGRDVRQRRQRAGETQKRGTEKREPQARPYGIREVNVLGVGLWRPPRDRIGSSPARYKKWAPRPCPWSRAGGGGSCLSAAVWGGPAPPRASLCKAPAPARSASALGEGHEGRGVLTGEPGGRSPGGAWPGASASAGGHGALAPREKGPPPVQSEVLALCFSLQSCPRVWAASVRVPSAAPGPGAAAHTVLSSIHSVLVKARRARTEPSPSSPSSPAAPPPATSRCGVERWRFVRRARRG